MLKEYMAVVLLLCLLVMPVNAVCFGQGVENETQTEKPEVEFATGDFQAFADQFQRASKRAGRRQYLVPYFIASHPGSDLDAMIELALFLKRSGYRPDQVQDFIPAPLDVATAMYHTGLDPFTKQPVFCAQKLRDRTVQRALLQFFKPENYFEVRRALEKAGRQDLIGDGCDCLIPPRPPKEALSRRRQAANDALSDRYVHQVGESKKPRKGSRKQGRHKPGKGYRPERREHKP